MREFEMCLKRTENEKWAVVYVVVDGAGVTICRGLSDGDLRCFGSRRRSFSGHPPRLDEAQNCAVAHTADSTTRVRPPSLTSSHQCRPLVGASKCLYRSFTASNDSCEKAPQPTWHRVRSSHSRLGSATSRCVPSLHRRCSAEDHC